MSRTDPRREERVSMEGRSIKKGITRNNKIVKTKKNVFFGPIII